MFQYLLKTIYSILWNFQIIENCEWANCLLSCDWPYADTSSHEHGRNFYPRETALAQTEYQDNSTSGRGARASYQTMLPEISARRSLLWVKVQIPVVTDRHWGREKSAPRPYSRSLSSTQLKSYIVTISKYTAQLSTSLLHVVHASECLYPQLRVRFSRNTDSTLIDLFNSSIPCGTS